jgi:hypothetical protein
MHIHYKEDDNFSGGVTFLVWFFGTVICSTIIMYICKRLLNYFYTNRKKILIRLQKLKDERYSDQPTCEQDNNQDVENMKTMFEIHITVSHEFSYQLHRYCQDHNCSYDHAAGPLLYKDRYTEKDMEFASGSQLMLTKKIFDTLENAVKNGLQLHNELEKYGVKVLRVKLEVFANSPFVKLFHNKITDYFDGNDKHLGYYEFHFKVKLSSLDEEIKLIKISKMHEASFAYNLHGSTKDKILITLRIRASSPDKYESDVLPLRDKLIINLQDIGLNVESSGKGSHYEYVVYDTHPQLDTGFVETVFL